MDRLPSDPFILMSYINTKLRDDYASLDDLCDDMDVNRKELEDNLRAAGFEYNPVSNKFI